MYIEELIKESKKIIKELKLVPSFSNLKTVISEISELKESDISEKLYDHIFNKFIKSKELNLESFLANEFMSGVTFQPQIKTDLKVTPERPVEQKDELEEEDEDNEETLPEDITNFLEQIGLSGMEDEKMARVYLIRFKNLISNYIDDPDVINLIIYLLHKSISEPDKLEEGEISELQSLIKQFTVDPKEEVKESLLKEVEVSNDKLGIGATMVAATLLFGIGGLLVAGIVTALAYRSDKDAKEDTKKLSDKDTKDKIENGEKLDKDKQKEIKDKPKADPSLIKDPKGYFKAVASKIGNVKDNLVNKAKLTVKAATGDKDAKSALKGWNVFGSTINEKGEIEYYQLGDDGKRNPITEKDYKQGIKPFEDYSKEKSSNKEKPESEEEPKPTEKEKQLDKDVEDMDNYEKETAEEKKQDAEILKPDAYKKKWGKCPDGFKWDSEKNKCVKSSTSESLTHFRVRKGKFR